MLLNRFDATKPSIDTFHIMGSSLRDLLCFTEQQQLLNFRRCSPADVLAHDGNITETSVINSILHVNLSKHTPAAR